MFLSLFFCMDTEIAQIVHCLIFWLTTVGALQFNT
jgi:hypothetical protein